MPNATISDAEILRRIKVEEDGFVERKSLGDWKKDAVKTCVAFANSCSVDGLPGLLCIGVKDDGTIEPSTQNLDSVQKSFERELKEAYPEIPHQTRIVLSPEGKFLAVIVPGSTQGPHFSGPAYIRVGSQTVEASKEQFDRIIDRQDRRVREILKWKNKQIKLVRVWPRPGLQRIGMRFGF
jgi:predicted HTH transcriptional regulator